MARRYSCQAQLSALSLQGGTSSRYPVARKRQLHQLCLSGCRHCLCARAFKCLVGSVSYAIAAGFRADSSVCLLFNMKIYIGELLLLEVMGVFLLFPNNTPQSYRKHDVLDIHLGPKFPHMMALTSFDNAIKREDSVVQSQCIKCPFGKC